MTRPRSSATPNEKVLAREKVTTSDLASSAGAGGIGILDIANRITATTVEGALAENRAAIDAAAVRIGAVEADYLDSASIGATVQAHDSDLDAIAAMSTTAFGRGFLEEADASSARSTLGLATVAASGSYGDLSGRPLEAIRLDIGDETEPLTTGTKRAFRMPYAFDLTEVRASVTTAPTDAALVIDVNEAGVSIFSTALSIDSGESTSVTASAPAILSDTSLADDAEITIDVDQIGSTVAGAGLKVVLIGRQA